MKFGALKAAVIIMGILIIAGMAFLVYGLSVGLHKNPDAGDDSVVGDPLPMKLTRFGDIIVDLPDGAQINDYKIQGDRLVVSISVLGGGTKLIIVDLASGSRLGTITLN